MKIRYDYIYLGIALNVFAKINIIDWEFYAILVPFAVIDTFFNYKK